MIAPHISIRPARLSDLKEILELFLNTINTVCGNDYSAEQIKAWTSSIGNTERWTEHLTTQYFLIAGLNGKIVGFASLANKDLLDFMFVHKDHQRQGIANRLYTEIEQEAIRLGTTIIQSNVSRTARPFFEKKGFRIQKEQTNIRQGVEIMNYKMTKYL